MKARAPHLRAPRNLTREMIVQAATKLLRELGLEALSMRRLAETLEVSATALYYHVGSKDELIDSALTQILGALVPVGDGLPWAEALEELLVRLQYLAAEHPGMPAWLAEHLESHATLLWMELVLRILERGGFRGEQLGAAMAIVGFYNSPVPLRGHPRPPAAPWDVLHPETLAARLTELGPTELGQTKLGAAYPTLSKALPYVRQPDEALFRLGLRTLIAGLQSRLAAASDASRSDVAGRFD